MTSETSSSPPAPESRVLPYYSGDSLVAAKIVQSIGLLVLIYAVLESLWSVGGILFYWTTTIRSPYFMTSTVWALLIGTSIVNVMAIVGGIGCCRQQPRGRRWLIAWAWISIGLAILELARGIYIYSILAPRGSMNSSKLAYSIDFMHQTLPRAAFAVLCLIILSKVRFQQTSSETP